MAIHSGIPESSDIVRPGGRANGATRPSKAGPYATRYACQAVGIDGLTTWMNTCGLGVRGGLRSCMPTWRGSALPLRRLHGAQEATMFSQLEGPPFERGTTWSRVRLEREPQY